MFVFDKNDVIISFNEKIVNSLNKENFNKDNFIRDFIEISLDHNITKSFDPFQEFFNNILNNNEIKKSFEDKISIEYFKINFIKNLKLINFKFSSFNSDFINLNFIVSCFYNYLYNGNINFHYINSDLYKSLYDELFKLLINNPDKFNKETTMVRLIQTFSSIFTYVKRRSRTKNEPMIKNYYYNIYYTYSEFYNHIYIAIYSLLQYLSKMDSKKFEIILYDFIETFNIYKKIIIELSKYFNDQNVIKLSFLLSNE